LHTTIHDGFIYRKDKIFHDEQVEQGQGRIVAQRCSLLQAKGIVSATD